MPPARCFRVTPAIHAVMTAILEAAPETPAWGVSICERTGYNAATVYPALDKLMQAGWIMDR